MDRKELSREELEKLLERQDSIIRNYESVSSFYKKVKNNSLLGHTARVAAGILKNNKLSSTKIISNIKSEKVDVIAICNPHFSLGVRSATFALTPNVIEVSEIFNRKTAVKVARQIAAFAPKKVILSGYSTGYDLLAEEIKKTLPKTRIFAYIHSSFIWFDVYADENPVFEKFLELEKIGVIEKIGFCKNDVAEYFKQKGVNAFFVMNRFTIPERAPRKINKKGKIKIGVFGANLWHRNILNQVVAALMIPNTEIHVNEIGNHKFLDQERIVVHGFLPKEEFNKLFSDMDINMYISLTDCFPMNLIESMANGIPAIASDTTDVYSFSPKLKEWLIVSTVDGPIGISKKLAETIAHHEEIQEEISEYLPVLKVKVEKSIQEFLK